MSVDRDKIVNLTIDGRPCRVQGGTKLLQACESLGIEIPTLCYLKDLAPDGSCRMCVVEVEGGRKGGLATACTEECAEGMVIHTRSPKVVEARRFVLDLLMSNHVFTCFSCARNGDCRLQDYSLEYGLDKTSYPMGAHPHQGRVDDSNPFYEFNPEKCIMCRRCARTCELLQGRDVLSVSSRGGDTFISPAYGLPRGEEASRCESCGNCVQNCPTGALSSKDQKKRYRAYEVQKTRTTCPHCAVGCQLDLLSKNGRLVGAQAAYGPTNKGLLCVKGRFGSYKFVHAGDRLKTPLIRKDGELQEASWDEAMGLVAEKLSLIKKRDGANAIAGFSCSRSPNEDNYLFQKMMRAAVGTNNVDNCARV